MLREMDPEKSSLDSELSQSLLEGLLSALSAAAALQYSRELYAYLEQLQTEIRSASGDSPDVKGFKNDTKLTVAAAKLEANYALLMVVIGQIRECVGPACARSRNALERLKRLIARARKFLLGVREGLLEIENLEKE